MGSSFAITYVVRFEGVELARATLERTPMAADARIVPLSESGLSGTLYVPPGEGPHPTILVRGGSEGGQPDFTAAHLETMGYATLALVAATIPVDDSDAPILLIGAEDDGVWPSCRLMGFAWARLEASGHVATYGDEQVCLPGAGHGVGVPGWPTEDSYAARAFGIWLVMGGTPEGNGRGGRELDTRLRRFLAAHL